MCDVWPVTEKDCCIPLQQLINDERLECRVCLDTESSYIELVDDFYEAKLPKSYVIFPSYDELLSYEESIRTYVDMLDSPIDKRPSKYIKESGQMVHFREWYKDQVADRFIGYLKGNGYNIKDVSVKREIVEYIAGNFQDVCISDEKVKDLASEQDNIRILIGSVYKVIAEVRLRKTDEYAIEHPEALTSCTIIFE